MPAPPRKKIRANSVIGSRIRYDEDSNSYRHGSSYVNFGAGPSRVFDVPDIFLKADVVFDVLSEANLVLTVGNPRSLKGGLDEKGIRVGWVLSRHDKNFVRHCSGGVMERILRGLECCCDSACLNGIWYQNEFRDTVTIHLDGSSLREICGIMGQAARPLYVRGADLLNKSHVGHRSNGDSVVRVSSIPPDDLDVYKVLVRERIMRAKKVSGQEYLITAEVDGAEETIVRSFHDLSRRFDVPAVEVGNAEGDRETLIGEQLEACRVAMNNPVSYITGFPGTGKTSCVCRILRGSRGTVVLTPSHVSKEVVCRRAAQNGVDPDTFSVEVMAFAVRHVQEWLPGYEAEDHEISQRSKDFMKKFVGVDGEIQIETLLVDEASMCGLDQSSRVVRQFCQIESVKRIVFCGDYRQLQSVSKGRILQDMIACESIPGTILEVNHRSGHALSENLRRILKSSAISMDEDETFEIIETRPDRCYVETDKYGRERVLALSTVVDVFMSHRALGLPTHVFAYTHAECNRINEAIKTKIFGMKCAATFPDGCKVRIKDADRISPSSVFHRNEFVEIVANLDTKHFLVRRWDGDGDGDGDGDEGVIEMRVSGRLLDALGLGYASSIHAFQGSESPYVIIHGVLNCAYFL